eukprot:5516245-Pyramimonas_sp.AAC.1
MPSRRSLEKWLPPCRREPTDCPRGRRYGLTEFQQSFETYLGCRSELPWMLFGVSSEGSREPL